MSQDPQEEAEQEDVSIQAAVPQQVAMTQQTSPKVQAARLTNSQVQKNKGLQIQRESLKAGNSRFDSYIKCCTTLK